MAEHLQEFTAERWEIIKSVLSGEHGDKVSMTAAARLAGVTLAALRAWIRRSEARHPGDDPLIHEISPFMKDLDRLQGDALEDKMWERSMDGWDEPIVHKGEITGYKKKFDNKLLLTLKQVRDERYRPRTTHVNLNLTDKSEIFERLLAGHRLASANEERELTLGKGEYEVLDEPALPAAFVEAPAPEEDEDLSL